MNNEIDVSLSYIENDDDMIPFSFDCFEYSFNTINQCENNLFAQQSFEDDVIFEEIVTVTRLNCVFKE